MRSALLLFALASAGTARAGDGIFGTKTSPIASTSSGSGSAMGAMPLVQMFVALLVVLALLKWMMPVLFKKFSGRTSVKGNGIRVQETAAIGAANLYVVEVRGRSFLLGTTQNSVSCIAEVSEPREELPTFQELVDSSPGKHSFADSSISDAMDQLGRLKRLGY